MNSSGMMKRKAENFSAVKPVRIGSDLAIEAPAKAAMQTGGEMFEDCEYQKTSMCAARAETPIASRPGATRMAIRMQRSEAPRVGKEGVCTGRFGWLADD